MLRPFAYRQHLLLQPLPKKSKLICIRLHPRFFSSSSVSSLLGLCKNPDHLQQIHARFILHGIHQSPTLSSELIDCYSNLALPALCHKIFYSVMDPKLIVYGAFLRNLFKFGEFGKTLLVYQEMAQKSMYPDEHAYPIVMRACFQLGCGYFGRMVHGHVIKLGFNLFELVHSALLEMYQNCEDFGHAKEHIGDEPVDDLMHLNSLLFEPYRTNDPKESFMIARRMRIEGIEPDSSTFINLTRSVTELSSLRAGRSVHCLAIVSDFSGDLSINTALLTMYSKLRSLENARLLFEKMPEKDCVVWNLMIQAYSKNGYLAKSMELLVQMLRSGVRPDLFSAIAALSSITELKSLKWGKQLHANVIRNGSNYQVSVSNSLIDMYCKCDHLEAAQRIFDSLTDNTVISWSSMIKGYVSRDKYHDVLTHFSEMRFSGIFVDSITVINILPACVNMGALELVKYLHGSSVKLCLNMESSVNTAFLVSYAKCGCLEMARKLFDEEDVNHKDLVMWNSMISAYSKHGEGLQCFELYRKLKQSNIKPDQITFLGLLTACVNSGSGEEGWNFFKEMTEMYVFAVNTLKFAESDAEVARCLLPLAVVV